MTRIDRLKDSRKGATTAFIRFTRLKDKHQTDLFCCFEGDDVKYYGPRIENSLKIDIDHVQFFNCGGKSEVLRFYDMVNKDDYYRNVKFAYFVDRDFDPPLGEPYRSKVYETSVYSIENFYTTLTSFKKILKYEFNYSEDDQDYRLLIYLFKARQEEFHRKTKLFNSWLWCQRDLFNYGESPSRINLNDFNLKKIIPVITIREVIANYNIDEIKKLFPDAFDIPNDVLGKKQTDISTINFQERFRGKFEIDFLFDFIESIKSEFTNQDPIIQKKIGVKINQSKKNIIAEFSQYASTPDSLEKYLQEINYFKSSASA